MVVEIHGLYASFLYIVVRELINSFEKRFC